jgi:radical SAM-linked protein
VVPAPPRQRWRLVLARSAGAPELAGRELIDVWETALEASALPLFRPVGRVRGRIAFGAPIPATLEVERELADILLTEFVPTWRVREGLAGHLPDGWRLVDLYDVWLGSPALAGQVAAADYRIGVTGADAPALAAAVAQLLASTELPRERQKGGASVRYDLRPLLVDTGVVDQGPPVVLRVRTRFHAVLGTGRPEEVVAALGDAVGAQLELTSIVRERLILAEEDDPRTI